MILVKIESASRLKKSSFTSFSYLPTKDLVSTSTLAKRWKVLWTFFSIIHDLEFDEYQVRDKTAPPFCLGSIHKELQQIPGDRRIRRFRLRYALQSYTSDTKNELMSLFSDIVRDKVEELDCTLDSEWNYLKQLALPDALFNSETLTFLKLAISVRLKIPSTICFPRLKTLQLKWTRFEHVSSAQLLISDSACPVLEELQMTKCSWKTINGLTISIVTLKRLNIDVCPILRISGPNIQSFVWRSISLFQLAQCNLPLLIDAKVLVLPGGNEIGLLAHRTLQLLGRISGLKSLTITVNTLEIISNGGCFNAGHFPEFYNLTHLKVCSESRFKLAVMMHILRKSPNLQSLEFPHGLQFIRKAEKEVLKDAAAAPLRLFSSLKTLRISNYNGGSKELSFLNYISKNATDRDFTLICDQKPLSISDSLNI